MKLQVEAQPAAMMLSVELLHTSLSLHCGDLSYTRSVKAKEKVTYTLYCQFVRLKKRSKDTCANKTSQLIISLVSLLQSNTLKSNVLFFFSFLLLRVIHYLNYSLTTDKSKFCKVLQSWRVLCCFCWWCY